MNVGFDIETFRTVSTNARAIEDSIIAEAARDTPTRKGVAITRETAATIAALVRQHDKRVAAEETGAHIEPGGVVRPEGYYHSALEPAETPDYCDRCGQHGHNSLSCPSDDPEPEEDEDEGYPGPCTDPEGHSWVVSDENEEISYCEHCGADGNA